MDRHDESIEGSVLDDRHPHGRRVLRIYRSRAAIGGGCIGMILGAALGGPFLKDWAEPLRSYALVILGSGAVGALTGFLFWEIIIGRLTAGGSVRGASNQHESSSSGESHAYEDD